MSLLEGMSQRSVGDDLVVVATTDPSPLDVAICDEVGDDRLCCTLGNPNSLRNISPSYPGVIGEAD
jgi:hypothetical protein